LGGLRGADRLPWDLHIGLPAPFSDERKSMSIETIPVNQLILAFLPVAVVLVLMWRWKMHLGHSLYALTRMLVQLLLIGYALVFIFDADSSVIIIAVLVVMLLASGWIALNTIAGAKRSLFPASLASVLLGGGLTLLLITQAVLQLDPWYRPSYMIPLAGMIFASSMTGISLAAERLIAELGNGCDYEKAKTVAFRTAMIPVTNALFAVGLISLPGMMTGQILSGVSPFIAARYQIMVMCMIFGATGISTACFLRLTSHSGFFRKTT
jgi:putative ABC transport system permease protein